MWPPSALESLRAQVRQIEGQHRRATPSLPFGVAAVDARLPGGALPLGALHEIAGGGNGAIDGAAAALFAAGIAARTRGKVLWCLTRLDLFAPALAQAGLNSDRRISAFDAEFVRWVKENEEAGRLTTIPGVGPIVASGLVAAIGRAESFDRGRDLAACLGLVPRQFTTGGKPKLLGISKRGNKYLRRQLIHGARAALPYVAERDTPLGRWVKGLMSRTHRNVVVVALANKLARIAWAVLQRGKPFDASAVSVAA